jgi:hypothetical protein
MSIEIAIRQWDEYCQMRALEEARVTYHEPKQQLTAEGLVYDTKNNGIHLVVHGCRCFIDYWPTTQKWRTRDGVSGFGVDNLIEEARRK